MRIALQRPSLVIAMICIMVMAVTGPARLGTAQLDVAGMIQPRCSRQAYSTFCEAIGAASSHEAIVEMVWLDYAQSIDSLMEQASKAADERGRQRVLEALDGKIRLSADEISQLRVGVLESTAQWWPKAAALVDQLLESTLLAVDVKDERGVAAALQSIRRTMLLHVLQDGAGRRGYAGEGMDVIQLIVSEQRNGGALESIDVDQIATIATAWATGIDQFLTSTTRDRLKSQLARGVALIKRDGVSLSTIAHEDLGWWARQQAINQTALDAIDALLSGNPTAQWKWRGAVKMMMYPWLYRIDEVDGVYEWIVGYSEDEDLQQKASTRYETYRQQREAMRETTIGLLLNGRRDHNIDLHDTSAPPPMSRQIQQLRNRVLQASGEQSTLTHRAMEDLDAMLGETRRGAARRYASRRVNEPVSGSPE